MEHLISLQRIIFHFPANTRNRNRVLLVLKSCDYNGGIYETYYVSACIYCIQEADVPYLEGNSSIGPRIAGSDMRLLSLL